MKKILVIMLCLSLMALIFVGCNNNQNTNNQNREENNTNNTTTQDNNNSDENTSDENDEVNNDNNDEVDNSNEEEDDVDEIADVTIATVGWVNVPFDSEEDPFKQYLIDEYGINAKVLAYAAADFEQQLPVLLASDTKPDLINFRSVTEFNKYYEQGSLIEDWQPYYDYAPKLVDQMMENELALYQLGTDSGGTKALFANGENPTWSLKVRQDWVDEYADDKNKGSNYQLATPGDVLDFARWIKTSKNEDQNNLEVYAFSSAAGGTSIGTTFEWTQGMFGHTINGLSNQPSRGFYITDDGDVSNPVIDGSFEKWLDFARTVVDEKLIDPNWFTNDWVAKNDLLFSSKIAFDWFPGVIVNSAFDMNKENEDTNNGQDTYGWFENMEVPTDGSSKYVGIPTSGSVGHIWAATVTASLDNNKMKKITKLLNDLTLTYDESKEDSSFYQRTEVYNKLRWGVGVINGIESFIELDDSKLVVCNIAPELPEGETNYRVDNPGAWDWGVWFSSRSDGVLQASSDDPKEMKFAIKAGELDSQIATMNQYFTPGAFLEYDEAILKKMFEEYTAFTYAYLTRSNNISIDEFIEKWRTQLEGDKMIEAAKEQYKEMGFID